jgi:hypothetical protein
MTPSGKIFIALLLFFLCPKLALAQQFKYATELNSVDTTGFYEIIIRPQINRFLKLDFSDIRIADKNNRWVPHIFQQVDTIINENLFTPFPIIQNMVNDSGKNLLIIENTKPEGINSLMILLKNAAVNRMASLSGSNNQQDWYIIDDNISINRSYEMIKDEYMQEINFPLAKYRYLKLVIGNAHNEPLLISRAGFYSRPSSKKTNGYLANPTTTFIQKDSINYSYILVKQADSYQFDKITISTAGTRFYNRDMQVCLPEFDKNNIPMPGKVIGNFKLKSDTSSSFYLIRIKTPLFYIIIRNGDSPPLKITSIQTALKKVALLSYLEKGKTYKLLLGDSLASFADYDLQSFKTGIRVTHVLNYGDVYPNGTKTFNQKGEDKNWWLWPAIILAGIVLTFLTYRLTGDINKAGK